MGRYPDKTVESCSSRPLLPYRYSFSELDTEVEFNMKNAVKGMGKGAGLGTCCS